MTVSQNVHPTSFLTDFKPRNIFEGYGFKKTGKTYTIYNDKGEVIASELKTQKDCKAYITDFKTQQEAIKEAEDLPKVEEQSNARNFLNHLAHTDQIALQTWENIKTQSYTHESIYGVEFVHFCEADVKKHFEDIGDFKMFFSYTTKNIQEDIFNPEAPFFDTLEALKEAYEVSKLSANKENVDFDTLDLEEVEEARQAVEEAPTKAESKPETHADIQNVWKANDWFTDAEKATEEILFHLSDFSEEVEEIKIINQAYSEDTATIYKIVNHEIQFLNGLYFWECSQYGVKYQEAPFFNSHQKATKEAVEYSVFNEDEFKAEQPDEYKYFKEAQAQEQAEPTPEPSPEMSEIDKKLQEKGKFRKQAPAEPKGKTLQEVETELKAEEEETPPTASDLNQTHQDGNITPQQWYEIKENAKRVENSIYEIEINGTTFFYIQNATQKPEEENAPFFDTLEEVQKSLQAEELANANEQKPIITLKQWTKIIERSELMTCQVFTDTPATATIYEFITFEFKFKYLKKLYFAVIEAEGEEITKTDFFATKETLENYLLQTFGTSKKETQNTILEQNHKTNTLLNTENMKDQTTTNEQTQTPEVGETNQVTPTATSEDERTAQVQIKLQKAKKIQALETHYDKAKSRLNQYQDILKSLDDFEVQIVRKSDNTKLTANNTEAIQDFIDNIIHIAEAYLIDTEEKIQAVSI